MIGFAAPTFDTQGALLFQENRDRTDLGTVSRRVSRRATLDGGAAFEDRGSYNADRTFSVSFTPEDEAQAENLRRLVETYRWLLVATREGLFRAAPSEAQITPQRVQLTLLVEEKRSA